MVRNSALLLLAAACHRGLVHADCSAGECGAGDDETTLLSLRKRISESEIKGYYAWSWTYVGTGGPDGTTHDVCFNGFSTIKDVMESCEKKVSQLSGEKWVSFGGDGNHDRGVISPAALADATAGIATLKEAGFQGIMFDVEVVEGTTDELTKAFADTFAAFKAAGLSVGVTTSHSAPFGNKGNADLPTIIKKWVSDTNVDILSPQLYTTGQETAPDFSVSGKCAACTWDLYKGSAAKFAPSIVEESHYSKTTAFFAQQGITTAGYFRWKQAPGPLPKGFYCGKDWADANDKCKTECDGSDTLCAPFGEKCFTKLPNCPQ